MFSLPVDEEITLKLPEEEDAQILFSLVDKNREFLRPYLSWVDDYQSIKDVENFIENNRLKFEDGSRVSLCIVYKGLIAGVISLRYVDKVNKATEFEYWLAKNQQGKGLVQRSCCALIKYVFEKLHFHRIEICCASHNLASQHVPEHLGFKKDGVFREGTCLNNKFYDTIVYSMLATDAAYKELRHGHVAHSPK